MRRAGWGLAVRASASWFAAALHEVLGNPPTRGESYSRAHPIGGKLAGRKAGTAFTRLRRTDHSRASNASHLSTSHVLCTLSKHEAGTYNFVWWIQRKGLFLCTSSASTVLRPLVSLGAQTWQVLPLVPPPPRWESVME
jgi:hypothetical protein